MHVSGKCEPVQRSVGGSGVGISAKGGVRSLRVGDLGVAWLQLFEFRKGDFAYKVWGRGNMRGNLCAFIIVE